MIIFSNVHIPFINKNLFLKYIYIHIVEKIKFYS